MIGLRLPDGFHGQAPRGSFWRDEHGEWSCCTPNGRIGSLRNHEVIEHADGTITVSPSILVFPVEPVTYTDDQLPRMIEAGFIKPGERTWPGRPGWHGFLQAGTWREA